MTEAEHRYLKALATCCGECEACTASDFEACEGLFGYGDDEENR